MGALITSSQGGTLTKWLSTSDINLVVQLQWVSPIIQLFLFLCHILKKWGTKSRLHLRAKTLISTFSKEEYQRSCRHMSKPPEWLVKIWSKILLSCINVHCLLIVSHTYFSIHQRTLHATVFPLMLQEWYSVLLTLSSLSINICSFGFFCEEDSHPIFPVYWLIWSFLIAWIPEHVL